MQNPYTKVRDPHAEVVKLVDTLASGASGGNPVEVQVLSSAPSRDSMLLDSMIIKVYDGLSFE